MHEKFNTLMYLTFLLLFFLIIHLQNEINKFVFEPYKPIKHKGVNYNFMHNIAFKFIFIS